MSPDGGTPLGPGAEFDRIRSAWRRLGTRARGLGDDCAIVEPEGEAVGERLAVSTDLVVEGTHFRPGWLEPRELGWRAAAAALSDLAAVAASPWGVLASVGMSPEWPEDHLAELMAGVGDAAQSVGASVWGGDLVRSARLVLDVVVVGRVDRPVRRVGATPGDALWVTGALGGPAAALAAWLAGTEPDREARERFARPAPRIAEARWLAEHGARAMIDVSDGLLADARHLAAASGVRILIERDRVPVHAAASAVDQALTGGEEFELLVALPDGVDPGAEFGAAFEAEMTRVGEVGQVSEVGEVVLLAGGEVVELPRGFEHF
ncbi:MAG: thiamine-phosphate kinase [Gemmatimonadales bacterium]